MNKGGWPCGLAGSVALKWSVSLKVGKPRGGWWEVGMWDLGDRYLPGSKYNIII